MTQPLRTAHRILFLLLGIALPLLFARAITSRSRSALAPSAKIKQGLSAKQVIEQTVQFGDQKFSMRLMRLSSDFDEPRFALLPTAQFAAPELLLYWSPDELSLPPNAILIGSYQPEQEFRVPGGPVKTGFLVLYDNSHKRVILALPLEKRR